MNPYQSLVYAIVFAAFGALASMLIAWRLIKALLRRPGHMHAFVRGLVTGYHASENKPDASCVLCHEQVACFGCGRMYVDSLLADEDAEGAVLLGSLLDTLDPEQVLEIGAHLRKEQMSIVARLYQRVLEQKRSEHPAAVTT